MGRARGMRCSSQWLAHIALPAEPQPSCKHGWNSRPGAAAVAAAAATSKHARTCAHMNRIKRLLSIQRISQHVARAQLQGRRVAAARWSTGSAEVRPPEPTASAALQQCSVCCSTQRCGCSNSGMSWHHSYSAVGAHLHHAIVQQLGVVLAQVGDRLQVFTHARVGQCHAEQTPAGQLGSTSAQAFKGGSSSSSGSRADT